MKFEKFLSFYLNVLRVNKKNYTKFFNHFKEKFFNYFKEIQIKKIKIHKFFDCKIIKNNFSSVLIKDEGTLNYQRNYLKQMLERA